MPDYTTTSTSNTTTWSSWANDGITNTGIAGTVSVGGNWAYLSTSWECSFHQSEQEREAYAKAAEERATKEKVKEEKARQLLREVLTDEQDAQLEKEDCFELVSVKS